MRCLIIGSGGREHALAWKIRQSPKLTELFIAPGNSGTAKEGKNVPIAVDDIEGLVAFAKKEAIDLVIPAPELPLTLGIVDAMKKEGIACFGPNKWCAQLEGSKAFAKDIMQKAAVPTAACEVFTDYEKAKAYVTKKGVPLVIKADGLASGKGVTVARELEEAYTALHQIYIDQIFGADNTKTVIEDFLEGEEVSLLAFCDGETALPLPSAQDHKPIFDKDQGPNTGGMGAYSPAPILPDCELEAMTDLTIRPILRTLKEAGQPFVGILYAGLMISGEGDNKEVKVLEYNTRFGDPECQVQLIRLNNDILDIIGHCLDTNLHTQSLSIKEESSLGVVMAAHGYPQSVEKGAKITGIDKANGFEDSKVFEAGAKLVDGESRVDGGRVLCVTSLGKDLAKAQASAYHAVSVIHFDKAHYRTDIGSKGLARLKK